MRTVEELIKAIHEEALLADFPVDEPVYERAGKDPKRPILFAGSLDAPICAFARDLGKDEVLAGQPMIGAAGRLVRSGVHQAALGKPPPASDRQILGALEHILLTNTVPYKPPGNKAYAESVKKRFRPFLAEFLTVQWKGKRVLCLGTEAFHWFDPYAGGAASEFWKRDDRYEAELPCEIVAQTDEGEVRKPILLCPLPHPSPLNQRWYPLFPKLLAGRLERVWPGE
ncbi:hypothetical protein BH23PLA1_BH23PLA1_04290 [soil metagenome]